MAEEKFDDFFTRVGFLQHLNYEVELGIVSGNKERKEVSIGLNNAELMYIHENGATFNMKNTKTNKSYTVHIPSRPVLGPTIEYAIDHEIPQTLDLCMRNVISKKLRWGRKEVERELTIMCKRIASYAKNYMDEGKVQPQLPETNRRKRKDPSAKALVDTGNLRNSITCRLVKL